MKQQISPADPLSAGDTVLLNPGYRYPFALSAAAALAALLVVCGVIQLPHYRVEVE